MCTTINDFVRLWKYFGGRKTGFTQITNVYNLNLKKKEKLPQLHDLTKNLFIHSVLKNNMRLWSWTCTAQKHSTILSVINECNTFVEQISNIC